MVEKEKRGTKLDEKNNKRVKCKLAENRVAKVRKGELRYILIMNPAPEFATYPIKMLFSTDPRAVTGSDLTIHCCEFI